MTKHITNMKFHILLGNAMMKTKESDAIDGDRDGASLANVEGKGLSEEGKRVENGTGNRGSLCTYIPSRRNIIDTKAGMSWVCAKKMKSTIVTVVS